jgi:hypothetical protein
MTEKLAAGCAVKLFLDYEKSQKLLGYFILDKKSDRVGKDFILNEMPEKKQEIWGADFWYVTPVSLTELGESRKFTDKPYPLKVLRHVGISPSTSSREHVDDK